MLAPAARESRSVADISNFVDVLRDHASRRPDATAFEYLRTDGPEVRRLSYGQLDQEARAVSRLLRGRQLAGQNVILAHATGLEYVIALFGCFYAGVTVIPFYPARRRDTLHRFNSICADAGVKALLSAPLFANQLGLSSAGPRAAGGVQWLDMAQASHLSTYAFDESTCIREPAVIQYSSGSTEAPKGIVVTHANLWNNQKVIQRAFAVTERSMIINWVPLHHDMGLVGGILHSVFAGAQCLLMAPATMLRQPLRWLRTISRHTSVVTGGPNAAYDLCVEKIRPEERAGLDLSGWEIAFNGSETVRWETMDRFFTAYAPYGFRMEAFRPCYGLAEATLMVAAKSDAGLPMHAGCDQEPGDRIVACGTPDSDHTVVIVDPENHRPLPSHITGEIWVAGPSIARGYWNRAEQSARTFRAELRDFPGLRFLRTGDLGFFAGDQLFVAGRIKDVIIVNGRNVYPQDLEYAAAESDPVLSHNSAAAFSVEVNGKQRLVILHEVERSLSMSQLTDVIERIRLAVSAKADLVVHSILLLDPRSIPRTTSGKIRRSDCRAGFLKGAFDAILRSDLPEPLDFVWPDAQLTAANTTQAVKTPRFGSHTAEELAEWLRRWLVREARIHPEVVRPSRPFADFGLDSSTTIMLVSDLEDFLGYRLDATLVWDYPTIATLTEYLADESRIRHAAPNE